MRNLVVCIFSDGNIIGSTKNVGNATSDQNCFMLVMEKEPIATGVIFTKTGECSAAFGTRRTTSASHRACKLEGKIE